MAQYPRRAVSVFDRTLVHAFIWDLPHVALRSPQNGEPLLDQHIRRKGSMAGAAKPDECRDGLEVVAEYILLAPRHDRYFADPKFEEPLEALGIVEDVNGDEVHAFLRKKLLRSKTTASTGLGIEDELMDDSFHCLIIV